MRDSSVIAAVYDHDDVLRYANAAYESRFLRGLPLPVAFADVLRHGFSNKFGVHISSGDIESFLRAILPRRRSVAFRQFEVDTIEGEWIWMTESLADGWLLSIGSIITPLKDHERLLARDRDLAREIADTDALTGALSRRRILEIADTQLRACQQRQLPCSLVLLDLDHFKIVNDTLGHLAGDELLVHFASGCTRALRQQDRFGRYGGEEFLLVLPEARGADVVRLVDRVRALIGPVVLAGNVEHAFTFSAGVAEARPDEALHELLLRTDATLYRAKRLGRDRTELAPV
jgi:diguanylate cyclase